ncbi:hypothetical protein XELAEV_18004736mg [Xenopus laevis]|uniref:Uncharacterized protein n=1 Tax=Xenopus laevis TaxID=8355 RepID=A0A974BQZ1_XENLA|nr:hypothetical protein XELAEV_18004736mg [Xenopus laevis]
MMLKPEVQYIYLLAGCKNDYSLLCYHRTHYNVYCCFPTFNSHVICNFMQICTRSSHPLHLLMRTNEFLWAMYSFNVYACRKEIYISTLLFLKREAMIIFGEKKAILRFHAYSANSLLHETM